jgi:hypothetical protein
VCALLLTGCDTYQSAGLTEDPCGGAPEKARYSNTWIRSELIRNGHPKTWVCHKFSSPAESKAYQDSLPPSAAEQFSRFLRDQHRLVLVVYDAQKAEAKRLGKETEFNAIWRTPPPGR